MVSAGNTRLIGRRFRITSRSFEIGRTIGDLTMAEPSWSRRTP